MSLGGSIWGLGILVGAAAIYGLGKLFGGASSDEQRPPRRDHNEDRYEAGNVSVQRTPPTPLPTPRRQHYEDHHEGNISPKITLFHYTNTAGKSGIQRSGVIRKAQRHALFGEGVYFTKLDVGQYDNSTQQIVTKEAIARNNYTNGKYISDILL